MAPVCLHLISPTGKFTVKCRYFTLDGNGHFPQDVKGWTHKNKERRLGKGRKEDNVPASHGNEREAELTLPYGYLSCEEEKRN
jgi:hypothetical protein